MSDFTILIQGPLNTVSLSNIQNYKKYGKVIVSHWDEDDRELLKNVPDDVVVISQRMIPEEEWGEGWVGEKQSRSTFYWAFLSTYAGIKKCDTKYCIKTRSDEKYENLEPLIDMIRKDDSKFVFGNVFARNFKKDRFMFGDHIFAHQTDFLLKTYQYIERDRIYSHPRYCAEMIVFINYMRVMCEHETNVFTHPVFDKNVDEQLKFVRKYVECFDVNLLSPLVVRQNGLDKRWIGFFENPYGVKNTEGFLR